MPDQRPIGDLYMLHWWPIWNRHAPSETHLKPTCPIWDRHACRYLMKQVEVSNQACRSLVVLPSGMLVSNGSPIKHGGLCWSMSRSPIRHIGLRWVSNNDNIFVNSNTALGLKNLFPITDIFNLCKYNVHICIRTYMYTFSVQSL